MANRFGLHHAVATTIFTSQSHILHRYDISSGSCIGHTFHLPSLVRTYYPCAYIPLSTTIQRNLLNYNYIQIPFLAIYESIIFHVRSGISFRSKIIQRNLSNSHTLLAISSSCHVREHSSTYGNPSLLDRLVIPQRKLSNYFPRTIFPPVNHNPTDLCRIISID